MQDSFKMSAFGVLGAMLFPLLLAAQPSWSGRLATGAGLTNLRDASDHLAGQAKPGSVIGFGVAYQPDKHFGIQAEFLFEQKGNRPEITLTDIEGNPISTGQAKARFNYLVLPVTFHWRLGNDRLRYGPYLGTYWARLLQQTFVVAIGDDNTFKEDQRDHYGKSDIGAVAGFAADFALDELFSLTLETRYSLSLINTAILDNQKAYHQSLAFLIGLRFAIGKEI